jgi:tetratricopeptide (TPR) repeat protein
MKYWISALVFMGVFAHAEDLEKLLDSGSRPEAEASVKKEAGANSALFYILETLLPNPTPDQSMFIRDIEASDWNKALIHYPVAFDGTPFQKTPNGRALFALAHFKSGMPVTGLELLFNIDQPRQIHPEIRKMWREAAPVNHYAWGLAQIKWNPAFTEVFPADVEFHVLARELGSQKNPEPLQALFTKLPSSSPERGRIGWQLVIAYSAAAKVEEAAKTLAQVMKAQPAPVSQDLMNMTAARLLYQRGFFSAAIKYYEKITHTSEYWPDAQEEIAWSYVRKGEPANAIATSQSLMLPAMTGLASAESSFVHSLGQLKVCDYGGVLATLGDFPKRFKSRSQQLKDLASSSETPAVKRVVEELKTTKLSTQKLGKDAQVLPRLLTRDERLYEMAQTAKYMEAEAKAADYIYSLTMSNTGLQGYFDKLKINTLDRARRAGADAQSRVKEMALQEAFEIKEILRKLHIVEAEVIQQMAINERAIAGSSSGSTGAKSSDTIKFPGDKEVWFDEIGNYRVDVKKSCRGGKKGKST